MCLFDERVLFNLLAWVPLEYENKHERISVQFIALDRNRTDQLDRILYSESINS